MALKSKITAVTKTEEYITVKVKYYDSAAPSVILVEHEFSFDKNITKNDAVAEIKAWGNAWSAIQSKYTILSNEIDTEITV